MIGETMTLEMNGTKTFAKDDAILRDWLAASLADRDTTATDLAHAIHFGRAQEALEAVAAGGAGLTADHARAIHFANEMAELRHYAPLIAVDDGLPILAPGVAELIASFQDLGLWQDQPVWNL